MASKDEDGEGCHVTRRRGSVTLSVSQGDGCTLLGPAAPPALSEEPAAPDTDTSSHTDRPKHDSSPLSLQTRPDGTLRRQEREGWKDLNLGGGDGGGGGILYSQTEPVSPEPVKQNTALCRVKKKSVKS